MTGPALPSGVRPAGPVVVVAALVATVAAVVAFGVLPVPRLPAVAADEVVVPAALVVQPDARGCVALVLGDGTSAGDACVASAAWGHAVRLSGTELAVGTFDPDEVGPGTIVVDVATGTRRPGGDVAPPAARGRGELLATTGDEVRDDDGEVLLRHGGRWAPELRGAVRSPDGSWLVVQDGWGRVLAQGPDGVLRRWATPPDDRWVDLAAAVQWDGATGPA